MRTPLAACALVGFALLVGGCGGDDPPDTATALTERPSRVVTDPADVAAIRDNFEQYRLALQNRDGAAIPPLVSHKTVDYYQELAHLAATAGPEEIADRSFADRFTVARLRADLSTERLSAMDGAALLRYSIESGLFDESSVADNRLGEIRIAGDRGFARVVVRGKPTEFDYEYVREGPDWTFDVVATFPILNGTFAELARRENLSEDDLIFELVHATTGKPIDESIFRRP